MVVVGIDLGTAHCSVAVWEKGKIALLENEHGHRKTPSVVAFTDDERLIGEAALNQMTSNTANTIFNVKRIIGWQCESLDVRKDIRNIPYLVEDDEGIPIIQVMYKGKERKFFPEQITAMLLTKLNETVERHHKEPITEAVITVPANFTSAQRRATQQAALIAGIPVTALISEPVAAAISFASNREIKERRNVMIFHLGAGYFSVTVLTIEHGIYSVKAVIGNSKIGGHDFSDRMVNHFKNRFYEKHSFIVLENAKATSRLRNACEKAKRELCDFDSGSVKIDALAGIDFEDSVTRTQFAAMSDDLWGTIRDSVLEALKNAGMGVQEIDDVVAIGSATRMPIIREVLMDHCGFEAAKIRKTINIDEAAVMGAAEFAAGHLQDGVTKLSTINEITSNALMLSKDGEDSFILGRGTCFPMSCSYNMNRRKGLAFTIYEMELLPTWVQGVTSWNFVHHQIGKYHEAIDKRESRKSEDAQAKILFKYDSNGLLEVNSNDINLIADDGLSLDRMKSLITESERYQSENKNRIEVMKKLHELERGVYDLQKWLKCENVNMTMKESAVEECDQKLQWIKENKNPSIIEVATKLEELDKLRERMFANTQQSLWKDQNWPSEFRPPQNLSPTARNPPGSSYTQERYGATALERHLPSDDHRTTQQSTDGIFGKITTFTTAIFGSPYKK